MSPCHVPTKSTTEPISSHSFERRLALLCGHEVPSLCHSLQTDWSPTEKILLQARLVQRTQSLVTDSPCYSSPNKQYDKCDKCKGLTSLFSLCLNVYFNSLLKAQHWLTEEEHLSTQHGFVFVVGANHLLLVSWCCGVSRRALNGRKSIHLQVFLLS